MSDQSEPLPRAISRTAQLAERLGREIRAGKMRPGEQLPTEQELIAKFQVSRTVVREAMASLRAEGLIVSRQGAGVFVADNATARPFRIISDDLRPLVEVENVLQLRLAVEVARRERPGCGIDEQRRDESAAPARESATLRIPCFAGSSAVRLARIQSAAPALAAPCHAGVILRCLRHGCKPPPRRICDIPSSRVQLFRRSRVFPVGPGRNR